MITKVPAGPSEPEQGRKFQLVAINSIKRRTQWRHATIL